MTTITIAVEPARQPEIEQLLRAGEEYARELYTEDECFMLDITELEKPGVTVFVARDGGRAVGMAALVEADDGSAELKRLFVDDGVRGRGVAGSLLDALELHAGESGIPLVQLETGTRSHAAIALYEKRGYRHVPRFGQYVDSASSVCMEKLL
jgi:putative acetyltransferase